MPFVCKNFFSKVLFRSILFSKRSTPFPANHLLLMARRQKLSAAEFTRLFDKILERYLGRIDYNEVEKNASAFFGFREHDPFPVDEYSIAAPENAMSLKKAMVTDEEVFDYLTKIFKRDIPKSRWREGIDAKHFFNGQNLYNKYREVFKAKNKECTLQEPYSDAYAMFAGYDSLPDFLQKSAAASRVSQTTQVTHYRAFFYSYRSHDVREFTLQIDWGKEPFVIKQKGFHDLNQEPEYVGTATLVGGKIHAMLTDEDSGDQMKLIISSGYEPQKREAMLCAVQAVSSYKDHYPMCCEAILVREDRIMSPSEELRVKRYLFSHRYNFKVKDEEISLDFLEAKRRDVDMIDYLAGCYYRVWRFDEDYNIVQSVLHINEYYKGTCYTSHYHRDIFNEQVCLIEVNVSDALRSQTLCISTHPRRGSILLSYMMLNFPPHTDSKTMGGIICLTGHGYATVRSIALMKDEAIDANFDRSLLRSFSFDEAIKEVKNNPSLKPLFDKLLEEEMRSTKPEPVRRYFSEQFG